MCEYGIENEHTIWILSSMNQEILMFRARSTRRPVRSQQIVMISQIFEKIFFEKITNSKKKKKNKLTL